MAVVLGHGGGLVVIEAVRGPGEDGEALDETVEGDKSRHPHPQSAAGGHEALDVSQEGARHALRQRRPPTPF